jgi:hypothetical protein
MPNAAAQRAVRTGEIAAGMGIFFCLLGFVLALFYALAQGTTVHVRGLIDYVTADQSVSVQPAGSIPLTAIGLAVLSLPIAWLLAKREAPASKTV